MAENTWISEMLVTMPSKPEYTGEPDAGKLARPVRWGAVGKVQMVTRWLPTRQGGAGEVGCQT